MGKNLDFYMQCIKVGEMPHHSCGGLCPIARKGVIDSELLGLFEPYRKDETELEKEGLSKGWWASGLGINDLNKYDAFTPLRQTIVLFMAAINNEL